MINPLLDNEFLVKLNNDRNRTIYAHVISLNQYEHPIEQLEGVVTAGSITIDGQSAVRRVCSLTLSAKNLNINNVYWALTTKVKIEIGLQNNVDKKYDDIIWFPQGIFILTDFKTTQTINNYTINLTGKDKGCLINGDVSGNFPAPVRFDSYTDATQQSYTIKTSDNRYYNNFLDHDAYEALLEGFTERYGNDYQFIQGSKRILTLSYIPVNGNLTATPKIKFSLDADEQFISISSMANPVPEVVNGKNNYNINIEDEDIYGFIASNCTVGDKFVWTIEQKIPITIIIQEMLHQFGQEKYSNIIIRDIDPYALEMLDSQFDETHYLLHDGNIYTNFITETSLINNYLLNEPEKDGNQAIKIGENGNIIFRNYVDEDDISLIEMLNNSTLQSLDKQPTKIFKKGQLKPLYTVTEVNKDTVAGYGMTLLVYPDELIAQPGESITSVLDKIVNMMGDYEYFYDLNGQFIFQAKPAYIKTAWNKTISFSDENYIDASELSEKVAYVFDDSTLATQYQNSPNMNNIKNDYIIWGEKKNLSGNTIKFHGRYAIDNIPLEYTDFNGYTWTANRKEMLISALQEKFSTAISNYQHIYEYPPDYTPEEYGWWEINDWANYYQSIFGIDLSINSSWMYNYHKKYEADELAEGKEIFERFFLSGYNLIRPMGTTDVITLMYNDSSKTHPVSTYCHGSCSHYYAQFMDLRLLNKGWDYQSRPLNEAWALYQIINTWEPNKQYKLENGLTITQGYHPDYTTSFVYKPILPDSFENYTETILEASVAKEAYNLNGKNRQYAISDDVDWRHLIHIMADDWYAHHTEDDYEINLRMNNCWPLLNIDLYPYGRTGFEQYYLDFTSIGGFWPDIYDIYSIYKDFYSSHSELVTLTDDIVGQARTVIQIAKDKYDMARQIVNQSDYQEKYFSGGSYKYWHKDVVYNPENLPFWFDFFRADEMGIGKFAISVIGDRPKTVNDSAIKTIIYRDAPDVIYCSLGEYLYYKKRLLLKDGYKYFIIDNNGEGCLADNIDIDENNIDNNLNVKQNFIRSIRGKTVHDQADTMLYQYSYYNDTVNINAVPIYTLQPNTIISTKDELSKVTGYYVVNKINISLAYNGMMQITAIKSPERIY